MQQSATYDLYTLAVFYLAYSFLGWTAETAVASVKDKRFANRGFASGPFCFIYGLAAVQMAVGFGDLRAQPVFLFLFCMAGATLLEWLAGRLLERLDRRRWWDYSAKRFNVDGYICLQYSLLWGALGTVAVLWGNDLLARLYQLLPAWLGHGLVWAGMVIAALDQLASVLAVGSRAAEHPWLERLTVALGRQTDRLRQAIYGGVDRRIERAYQPAAPAAGPSPTMSFGDLVWLFVIGSFLGDVVETIFCRVTAGVWMSRSSLVWGAFSVVWGLALVLASVLLRREKDKTDRSIFVFGVVMGGAYEYVCSAVGEMLFGVVFWDYSGFRFNLGGRVNLLYCFFWGIAAVVWVRHIDPLVERMMDRLRSHIRPWMTGLLVCFLAADIVVSAGALARYDARMNGQPPADSIEIWLDEHFDNTRMELIYPNAKQVSK